MTAHEFFYKVWLASVTQKRLPAPKGITTKSPSLQRLTRSECDWIYFLMRQKGVKQSDVVNATGTTSALVSLVLNGKRSSIRVYSAVSSLLGYPNIDSLLREVRRMTA